MSVIMLAPYAAKPSSQERISFYQVKVLDVNETQLGWINTDAMAIALQEFGFAVLDTRKEKDLTFGQALFLMKQGHTVKTGKAAGLFTYDQMAPGMFRIYNHRDGGNQIAEITQEMVLATDWQLVKQ